jgi:hypothetical protein
MHIFYYKGAVCMNKYLFLMLFFVLFCCGCSTKTINKPKIKEPSFKIVTEETFTDTNECVVHVTTEATNEKGLDKVAKKVMQHYEDKGLDDVHLYIHQPDNHKGYGMLRAHTFIAYTEKGAEQVGLQAPQSYRVDMLQR